MATLNYTTLIENIKKIIEEYDAICILGPTASGKTRFAVNLALEIERHTEGGAIAEILSADSRQLYRGMDIGTGKDLDEYNVVRNGEKYTVPYHLIDIADAGEKYNIFRYQREFSKAYSEVKARGNVALICGGSGLYIEAATRGYELVDVEPDNALREELEAKPMEQLIALLTDLKKKNGATPHNNTDFDTKKRVIRAIEIEKFTLEQKELPTQEPLNLPQKTFYIGIDVDRNIRLDKIDSRLVARLKEGMINEVQRLLEKGVKPEELIYYGLEYKFVTQHITGEITFDEMVEKLRIAIHQFSKRQMTWFRGMERKGIEIHWVKL